MEDRVAGRRHAGGLRSQPLARLKQALREGRVKGATRELGERYGFHGGDIERVTHERQEREGRLERQDAAVREMERQRATARANGTPVAVTPAMRAAARAQTRAAVSRPSASSSHRYYTDSKGVRRNEHGAHLPDHMQPSTDERKRLAIERARKRMGAAGNGR